MEEIKFSKSRFSLMKSCLGKYFFEYILKRRDVKDTLWPGTIYGTAVHLYIEENLSKIKQKKDLKELPKFSETFYSEKKRTLEENPFLEYKTPRGFMESLFIEDSNKWSRKIMEFLFLYLPSGERVLEEEWKEEVKIGKKKIILNGIVDLQVLGERNFVFDFKNTKKPEGYYFVHWESDPQSLSYLYLLRKKEPSFSYLVFDIENGMILTQSRGKYTSSDNDSLKLLFKEFLHLHSQAEDTKLWSPSPEACRWCKFKEICKVKK